MQFFFAADRDNARLAGRYDLLSRPAHAPAAAHAPARRRGRACPITVCGEAAGRPLEALALIALGYRKLSMQASRIAPVKLLVRSVDMSALAQHVQAVLDGRRAVDT